jgi:hypothetical protein
MEKDAFKNTLASIFSLFNSKSLSNIDIVVGKSIPISNFNLQLEGMLPNSIVNCCQKNYCRSNTNFVCFVEFVY